MRSRSGQDGGGELINISSLLDVMFILIIFFLVTTTFKEQEIDHQVTLPVDARNQSLTQSAGKLLKINIRADGSYIFMGRQLSEEQIAQMMEQQLDEKPELKVLIRCDKDSKHLYLANIMSICRHVGVPKANIAVRTER